MNGHIYPKPGITTFPSCATLLTTQPSQTREIYPAIDIDQSLLFAQKSEDERLEIATQAIGPLAVDPFQKELFLLWIKSFDEEMHNETLKWMATLNVSDGLDKKVIYRNSLSLSFLTHTKASSNDIFSSLNEAIISRMESSYPTHVKIFTAMFLSVLNEMDR